MRTLTVKREKSFVGCAAKMKVYIEEANASEEICGVKCKLLGEIKNGDEMSFEIGNDETRLIVIADKLSAGFCNEIYQLPRGEENILLSGRNRFNPAAGNAFRFDGNDTAETAGNKKKSIGRGIIVLISAILIGFLIGYAITSLIFNGINKKEKMFHTSGMSITLNEGFEQQYVAGFDAVYVSTNVDVVISKSSYANGGYQGFTATQYARYFMQQNGYTDNKVVEENGLSYFVYETNGNICYAYAYKGGDAYWMVQFVVQESKAERYRDDITTWAKTVKFE